MAIDFARSYLHFRTDRVNHTPRLQIDAACTVLAPGHRARQFVLTCPCVGENMYVGDGLIQQPICEFVMVAEHRGEYAVFKRYAAAADDVHEAHRFGEPMATHSGTPATVTALDVYLAPFPAVEPIASYEQFRAALTHNCPVAGRTTYHALDGQTTVVLEYPCKTMNVAHGQAAWQVDAGPVLVPDFGDPAELLVAGNLRVASLRPAFLVFNTWDRAEMTLREPVTLGQAEGHSIATTHYRIVTRLVATNELFAAHDAPHPPLT